MKASRSSQPTCQRVGIRSIALFAILDNFTPGGLILSIMAGLFVGGFLSVEIPKSQKIVETGVIIKSDSSTVGDSQKHRKFVLLNESANIGFMEWMGAASSHHNIIEPLDVAIVVEQSDSSSLHGTKPLWKRVIIRRLGSLRDIPLGDILNEFPMDLPAVEKPTDSGCNQERQDTNSNTSSKVRGSVCKDHISLANVQGDSRLPVARLLPRAKRGSRGRDVDSR